MADTPTERDLKRGQALRGGRTQIEEVWDQCYRYTFPIRGDGLFGNRLDARSALDRKADLLDGTATDACQDLAAAIHQGLTPSSQLWAELDAGNDTTQEEKRWLRDAAVTLWENIHNSNFDAQAFEAVLDAVVAGLFALYIDEDREEGGLVFEQWALSGCYFASTRTDGLIDTCFRFYELPAAAVVREFGEDQVSEQTAKLAREKPDEMVELLHVIEPRKPYVVNAVLAKNLPFASRHHEVKAVRQLRDSGYHEFPLVVPRWHRVPRSPYAVGPVYNTLPDIKELNDTKFMQKAAMDLAVAGMWIAEDDGVLNPRSVKVGPRKIIVANSVDSMKELKSGADFNVAFTAEERLQAAIRKALMSDQLQLKESPQMTAAEVHARMALIRQLLGPVYGRFQAEYLKPLIERCFGLAYRAGALGRAPASLANRIFSVKYLSPMARAQRLEEVSAIDNYIGGVLQAAKLDPEAAKEMLDSVDLDAGMRRRGEALGVPAEVMRKPADIAKRRRAREQAAQQAQQGAVAAEVQAEAGKTAAKAVVGGGAR